MDIERVNEILDETIDILQDGERQDLIRLNMEQFGDSEESGEMEDDGPEEVMCNGNGGSALDYFMGFVADIASYLSDTYDIAEEDALDAILVVADELTSSNQMPSFPDADTASDTEMAAWTGVAKTLGFASVVNDYVFSVLAQDGGASSTEDRNASPFDGSSVGIDDLLSEQDDESPPAGIDSFVSEIQSKLDSIWRSGGPPPQTSELESIKQKLSDVQRDVVKGIKQIDTSYIDALKKGNIKSDIMKSVQDNKVGREPISSKIQDEDRVEKVLELFRNMHGLWNAFGVAAKDGSDKKRAQKLLRDALISMDVARICLINRPYSKVVQWSPMVQWWNSMTPSERSKVAIRLGPRFSSDWGDWSTSQYAVAMDYYEKKVAGKVG